MTSTFTSDLLSWLKLFWTNDDLLTYDSISDAFFLNEVFREIDSNAVANEQLSSNDSITDKIKNWEILIRNIRIYYGQVLQQAIVTKLPSISVICREQNSQKFQKEIDKAIFLILGSAVQCEKKEYFVEDIINRLPDKSVQHGLMEYIKKITEEVDVVVNYDNLSSMRPTELVFQLRNILERREDYFFEDCKSLLIELNDLQKQLNDQKNQMQVLRNVGLDSGSATVTLQSNKGIAVELAEYKAKLRKIQNEVDEKTDIITDLRNDLDLQQDENTKLKDVQMKLINETRRVRILQDEIDSHKESIIKLPIIEAENTKLKEKVNELEYYKARCEELREDLAIISNENANLLDKIDNNSKLVEQSLQVETEFRKASMRIKELEKDRSLLNNEIAKLEKELLSLQEKDLIHLSSKSELSNKLKQLQKDSDNETTISSISDQFAEKTNAKILRLEVENRSLKERLTEGNKIEIASLQEKISNLEIENERISNQVSRLQEANKLEMQKFMEADENRQLVLREKNQLELNIKTSKESDSRRIKELVQENESLSETILTIRERSEKSNDLRINELEKENAKLYSGFNEANHKISNLEFDLQRSIQKCNRLDQSLEKSQQDYLLLSKQNGDLNKELTFQKQFKSRLEELQDRFSTLEVDKVRLEALLTEYSQKLKETTVATDDKSEENLKQLATENQRKTSQLLKKISELESDLLKIRGEHEKCSREKSSSNKKIKDLQQELESCKVELGNLSRLESKLKLTEKNYEESEKEREQLQSQNLKLEQDLKTLDKDYRRLKNQSEVQINSIQQSKARILELEKKTYLLELKQVDNDEVDGLKASFAESENRLSDSEKKNRELLLQTKEEKRQCSTLREELLNERLETQSLRNQLQKLTDEFEKLGITEEEANSEKLKQLESRVNTAVSDTFKNKEDKNAALQAKLMTMTNREKELLQKLQEINAKYSALQQKYEEELNLRLLRNNKNPNSKEMPPYAQYILELKDDTVKLERKNAQLDSEKQFLSSQCQELKEKYMVLETKCNKDLQKLQKKYDETNSEKMKLHIEESTLKSQLDTLRNDNKNLANEIATNEKNLESTLDDLNTANMLKNELESQCNCLQKLNNQLSTDYDKIKMELDKQVSINKSLKADLNAKSEQFEKMKKSYDGVKHLQDSLENEKNNLADGARQLINLRIENSSLNEDIKGLSKKHNKLESDYKSVVQENKLLKSEHNQEKSAMAKATEVNSEMEFKVNILEKEILKMETKVEGLMQQNEQLKYENSKLLHQMKSMLMQNQELLTETLQTKQNHFTEEITLRERLNQLQRHKERLEEKIMEQYKTTPSTKKPKGSKMKLFRKQLMKRKDSKSSIDQDRKSPVDIFARSQRSHSCVTIFGDKPSSIKGDHSSDYHTEDLESISGPSPKLKSSRKSDVDSNSNLSSVSHRVNASKVEPKNKLIPGSMSIYDRDESERKQVGELHSYLEELHNKKLELEKKNTEFEDKSETDGPWVMKSSVSVRNLPRSNQRPQSAIDPSNAGKKSLPNQYVNVLGTQNGHSAALTFGNIVSKQTVPQSPKEVKASSKDNSISVLPTKNAISPSHPGVPARKASLPVTDRVEEEFRENFHFQPPDYSQRQSSISRPQSTVPATASSKEILQRLQKNIGRSTPQANDLRTRPRIHDPSEIIKNSINNISYKEATGSSQATIRSRPSSSLASSSQGNKSSIRKTPSLPVSNEDSLRPPSNSASKPETRPTPPVRKESGKTKPPQDNSSNKSESSDNSKPKVYYEYGHV